MSRGRSHSGSGGTDRSAEVVRPGALSEVLHGLERAEAPGQQASWEQALRPGAVIGRFELVREVGHGGFGVVYEARDIELGRLVAFKAVRPGPRQQVHEQRLLWEAEAAARLSHPNIVTLFDVGRAAEGPYLVMELLRGCTLARRLERGPIALAEALRIAIDVAKGLGHAHVQGVIHRDLTPGNVFLRDDGEVKILDLGLAHAFGHRKIDGGTPAYMAPEQWRDAPEDERTDVFALGVILFEMLTGNLPFSRREEKSLGEPVEAPPLDVEELPAMARLVARMLADDPVERPRDAREVLAALTMLRHDLERAQSSSTQSISAAHAQPVRRPNTRPNPDRTWLCSVVCMDIVGYADESVELQATWRGRFDSYLARALRDVPEADRIVLASGGGVAVCFVGDPEAALASGLTLLGTLVREEARHDNRMHVRVGMHLGPVKLVRDIDGNLNGIGDGLHVAQRVMSFAGDNQIFVSRSFYDVARCLSDEYRPLFTFGGARADEKGREYVVYELHATEDRDGQIPRSSSSFEITHSPPAPPDTSVMTAIESRAALILGPIAHHLARTVGCRASTPRELGEALAAFMPVSRDREEFLRSCAAASTSPEAVTSGPRSPPPQSRCSGPVLERARRDLAVYVGPIAGILVSRAAAKAASEDDLWELLATEIASPKDREAFRKSRARR
ncbi:MAG TPA: protein kinase [Myxococcales bacterium]|nr:protein kinase [Myxococcales bacterium]